MFRSCVSFGQSNRLMGVGARQQLNIHYRNTVLNFKHLLGRNFSDSIAQSFRPNIPAEVYS
jgi:molecular chaperone DnaK (HSP70)